MSVLRYLRKVVFNTYCVVFLVCFSSSCEPYVASFSGLSIFLLPLRYSLAFILQNFELYTDTMWSDSITGELKWFINSENQCKGSTISVRLN